MMVDCLCELSEEHGMTKDRISQVVASIAPSATIEIAAKAKQMKRDGIDVLSFATGEPDFGTPESIKQAAIDALHQEFTKYTEVNGIPELREAIRDKLRVENGIPCESDQIMVSNGAKQALYNAFRTLVGAGQEVIVPSPAYVSFVEQIKLAGGTPVLAPTDESRNFRLTANDLAGRITERTVAILVNSPNNPTGAVYTEEDLREIGNLAVENDLWIITDEVYEKICYGTNKHVSVASLDDRFMDRCITINGVSKTYAMTGWRLGYAAGPREIIRAMGSYQGHATGNINSITQKAAAYALRANHVNRTEVMQMVQEYAQRRDRVIALIDTIPGMTCASPDGAFYAFINVQELLGSSVRTPSKVLATDLDFAKFILSDAHVAVVPGTAFSAPGYIRISYAVAPATIEEGLARMKRAVEKLL
jgi:aspartate aminotransferase